MDRLTTRNSLCDGCPKGDWCHQDCFESQLYEKLAHYEDLAEQGRLVELPCVVGDTVYEVVLLPMMFGDMKEEYAILETKFSFNNLKDFGEWVFLTREEAEAKLVGGNNEDNL